MLLPTLHCATAGLKAMGTWSTYLLELHAWRLSQGQRMPSCRLPPRAIAKHVAEERLTVPLSAEVAQVRHKGTPDACNKTHMAQRCVTEYILPPRASVLCHLQDSSSSEQPS